MGSTVYIASVFSDIAQGTRFEATPAHVTLLPPVDAVYKKSVIDATQTALSQFNPFNVKVSDVDHFGPDNDIEVLRLEPASMLRTLHRIILEEVLKEGVVVPSLEYLGEKYNPHITTKNITEQLEIGSILRVKRIVAIEKSSNEKTVVWSGILV